MSYTFENRSFVTLHGQSIIAQGLFSSGASLPSLWVGLVTQPMTPSSEVTFEVAPRFIADDGTTVETGYKRMLLPSVNSDGGPFWLQTGGVLRSTENVAFPVALTTWGLIRGWFLIDAEDGGTPIAAGLSDVYVAGPYTDPDATVEEQVGDQVVIPAGGIEFVVVTNG